jgi:preprotein translocase subunit YajC
MDSPKFIFLILMIAVPGVSLAQEPSSGEKNEGRTAPSMRAADGQAPEGTAEQTSSPEVGQTSTAANASDSIPLRGANKKPTSLTEELISNPLNYVLILVVLVYVYLMFMQPKGLRKEQRELAEKLKNLKKNDRVVTTSGIHGIVANVNAESDTITLRVDENTNTKLTIDRMSIRSIAS